MSSQNFLFLYFFFTKIGMYWQISVKQSNVKFNKNILRFRVVKYGQIDVHIDASKLTLPVFIAIALKIPGLWPSHGGGRQIINCSLIMLVACYCQC
jgi:hypothetical protein